MKRGLVLLDPQEIPADELAGRADKIQRFLQQQGIAVVLVYGDVYHSGDITYLSNLCIYWNEGILAVPTTGESVFLSKLSSRVHPWMKSISVIKDLRSGPNLADLASDYLRDTPPGIVGLAEMDWWPASLVDDLQDKLPGWEFRNIGSIVRQERQSPTESELKLLKSSAEISANAVGLGLDPNLTNPERAGRAEQLARTAGVEDVYVFCHPATDQADTVEVIAEYRGYWTVAARVIFKGSSEWAPILHQAYQAAQQNLMAEVDIDQIRRATNTVMEGSTISWRVDMIHHTDLETHGDYRLPVEETNSIQEGSVVGLRLAFSFADGTQAVMADTFEIYKGGSNCLTKNLPQNVKE